MSQYGQMLEELKDGIQTSIIISNHDFLTFREAIILREDFKHFKGIAMQGGSVEYTYEKTSRS